MTDSREFFPNLDCNVRDSAKFAMPLDSIVFEAKTGEHWVLHGVYYVPKLHNSIISLGKLD